MRTTPSCRRSLLRPQRQLTVALGLLSWGQPAAVKTGAEWDGIAVAGPMSPGLELKTLERLAASANVRLHTFLPNLSSMFPSVGVLVCMGGYNTLVEAACKGIPTVCVPRTFPRREQLIRARAFERLGLLSMIEPDTLQSENLGHAIQSLIDRRCQRIRGRARSALSFDGARRAARHLIALASARQASDLVASKEPPSD